MPSDSNLRPAPPFVNSIEKFCRGSCGRNLPLENFHPHSGARDGHRNICKDCHNASCRQRRLDNLELYKLRKRDEYQRHKKDWQMHTKRHRERHPEKYAARMATGNAIRDGRLIKQPCEVCGTSENVQAHHDDYSKPLDVRWFCLKHHRELEGRPLAE